MRIYIASDSEQWSREVDGMRAALVITTKDPQQLRSTFRKQMGFKRLDEFRVIVEVINPITVPETMVLLRLMLGVV